MKRILIVLLTVILILTLISCGTKSTEEYDLYCYEINQLIKEIDFDRGTIDDGNLILYNNESEVFNEKYEKYNTNFEIEYIRKEDSKVFFVLSASVDDDEGIVFINDETNNLMDGLVSLERINGNSYRYKTFR